MRYIGAKTDLLPEIADFIKQQGILNDSSLTFCDAFSGTAAVGDYFKDKFRITANDIQYYSYVITYAKLNTPDMTFPKLGLNPFDYFNNTNDGMEGFIFNEYSDGGSGNRMYFSSENGKRIDFIRTKIESWHKDEKINDKENSSEEGNNG